MEPLTSAVCYLCGKAPPSYEGSICDGCWDNGAIECGVCRRYYDESETCDHIYFSEVHGEPAGPGGYVATERHRPQVEAILPMFGVHRARLLVDALRARDFRVQLSGSMLGPVYVHLYAGWEDLGKGLDRPPDRIDTDAYQEGVWWLAGLEPGPEGRTPEEIGATITWIAEWLDRWRPRLRRTTRAIPAARGSLSLRWALEAGAKVVTP